MTVYVDRVINYNRKIGHAGPLWCHMASDTADELHTMARKIGLQRDWCSDFTQPGSGTLHYDLTPSMRRRAVACGAKSVKQLPMELIGMKWSK